MGLFDFFKKKSAKKNLLPEIHQLPYFGALNKNSLENYYAVSAKINGKEIRLDLNFDNPTTTTNKIDLIKSVLENLDKFDKQNYGYISEDFHNENGEIVKSYVEHHLADCDEEELATLIIPNQNSPSPSEQLLNKIQLHRAGIYPDDGVDFIRFDYTIGREITQYLVVVSTNQNGELNDIAMES